VTRVHKLSASYPKDPVQLHLPNLVKFAREVPSLQGSSLHVEFFSFFSRFLFFNIPTDQKNLCGYLLKQRVLMGTAFCGCDYYNCDFWASFGPKTAPKVGAVGKSQPNFKANPIQKGQFAPNRQDLKQLATWLQLQQNQK
jgi:hypothetical protein